MSLLSAHCFSSDIIGQNTMDANPWLAGFGLTERGLALVAIAVIIGG
jgi:hypothetical protein